jgi:muramoyltetrapeptide carboxypeptidase
MITPVLHLKEGSIVDVIAPASACPRSELMGGLRYLKSIGLKPRMSSRIFGKTKLFANTDTERLKQLKAALLAPDSDAIWCVRGGYGSIRLLPELAKLHRPKKFKWLLGFSDITNLHAFLNFEWGWPSLHAPILARFGRGAAGTQEKIETNTLLFGTDHYLAHKLTPLNAAAKKTARINSTVCGGNMACLQASIGTKFTIDPKKKILFFEDVSERPHRMDRMLTQMEQVGWFRQASAVVFGDMSGLTPPDEKVVWDDVVERFAKSQKIPVLRGVKAGHGKLQRTIPFLTQADLKLGPDPRLEISLLPTKGV